MKDFLNNHRWLVGPAFLWKHEEDWLRTVLDVSVDTDDQEVRKVMVITISVCDSASQEEILVLIQLSGKSLVSAPFASATMEELWNKQWLSCQR